MFFQNAVFSAAVNSALVGTLGNSKVGVFTEERPGFELGVCAK